MRIIREHAGLFDAWSESHSQDDISSASRTPEDAVDRYGVTADSPLNVYSAGKDLEPIARRHFGKRLDYVFYRHPTEKHLVDRPMLKCTQSRVVFTEKVPGSDFSYSDHFGLEAIIEIVAPYETEPHTQHHSTFRRPSALADDVLDRFMQALTGWYRIAQDRSRKELYTFAACIVGLIALCIGSAWLPLSWIGPIFILVVVLLSWLGTTMLYAGFIYGNWERRALMNVIEELELIRQSNAREAGSSASPSHTVLNTTI